MHYCWRYFISMLYDLSQGPIDDRLKSQFPKESSISKRNLNFQKKSQFPNKNGNKTEQALCMKPFVFVFAPFPLPPPFNNCTFHLPRQTPTDWIRRQSYKELLLFSCGEFPCFWWSLSQKRIIINNSSSVRKIQTNTNSINRISTTQKTGGDGGVLFGQRRTHSTHRHPHFTQIRWRRRNFVASTWGGPRGVGSCFSDGFHWFSSLTSARHPCTTLMLEAHYIPMTTVIVLYRRFQGFHFLVSRSLVSM